MKAFLILEDGTVFEGVHFGAEREVVSEMVFNTSMTGYVEVLTDPSYAGQSVVMTYPLIGNYGVCRKDMESDRIWMDGLIVREVSRMPSNFRSEETLQHFLEDFGVPGISGIDTRALTKILREKGTMNGMITTNASFRLEEILPKLREYRVQGVVERVSCKEKTVYEPGALGSQVVPVTKEVAVIDVGTKRNIIRCLLNRGCKVTVYPSSCDGEEIISAKPDGIMITNGPGDPSECTELIQQVQVLADSGIPIFAICLGHQLMALANGAKTYKMKYGHRGANHPVKDLETGKVFVSSQNHGYVVEENSLNQAKIRPWFVNVNDQTIEGLSYLEKSIKTVQFHPEANAGPKDTEWLFDEFLHMMS